MIRPINEPGLLSLLRTAPLVLVKVGTARRIRHDDDQPRHGETKRQPQRTQRRKPARRRTR